MKPEDHVVIVGGGFSGALMAINLVRHGGPRATLVERAPARMGRGVAYSADQPEHLLNVRAAGMSALPDDPSHFTRWLAARGGGTAVHFVARSTYGDYLREMLGAVRQTAADRLAILAGDAVAIDRVADGMTVTLADGRVIAANAAVLALGNLPPHPPPGIDPAALSSACYVEDPWAVDPCASLPPGTRVVLLGSGLTAVDVALKLAATNFTGEIVMLSRRGLLPRRHLDGAPPPEGLSEPPRAPLSSLVGTVRSAARTQGWRHAVDALRPVTQRKWAQADTPTRARFLRHLRPNWDVHRHRLAPEVADRIDAMIAKRQLTVMAGNIEGAGDCGPDGMLLTVRPRRLREAVALRATRLVNCTGPQGNLTRSDDPLLVDLQAKGMIRPDALSLGIETDAGSRVVAREGEVADNLFCIGPMTRGSFWEIVAVPDIRRQCGDLARFLANAHWVAEGL